VSLMIVVISTFSSLPAARAQDSQPSRPGKSIHQIDWEQHRDDAPSSGTPKFFGQPRLLRSRSSAPDKEIFGYLPFWRLSDFPTLNYDLLTTIAYFGAEVDQFGNLVNLRDWPVAALINKAHDEGVRVLLTAILFNPDELRSLLTNPARRTTLIANLLAQVQIANADGVNIDFEGVPSGLRNEIVAFMTEISETFHASLPGSFVTIFTPAVDWNNVFDYLTLAQVTDGLVMQGYDYHWSSAPTAGPVAPLSGNRWGFPNVGWTVDDYLGKTLSNTSKLMLGVPFYGFDWPTVDDTFESSTLDRGRTILFSEAPSNAAQYGRLWDEESQTPWFKYQENGQWHQGWYDDSLSISKKFDLVNQTNLKGIAIWALGFDGQRQELQGAISDAFGSTAPPLKPINFRVLTTGMGQIEVVASVASGATGYRIYESADGVNFDSGTDFPGPDNVLNSLDPNSAHYFKVSALNGNGESALTQVLASRPAAEAANILIVDGFDRTSGTNNTFDFVRRYAPSLQQAGHIFDSCSNEAIDSGAVRLDDYATVIWISGEEGTATQSFSSLEQTKVADFLEAGGNLFVSGSEIGFDLVERGSSSDKLFYSTYFKARYIRDRVSSHSAKQATAGTFTNIGTVAFDDGLHGTYNVDFPDGILPVSGAVLNLEYDGFAPLTFGGAGVQYEGPFANSTVPGKLIYLGFPFETLYPAAARDLVLTQVLDFFGSFPTSVSPAPTVSLPTEFRLLQNYPNPFNPSTTIDFELNNGIAQQVHLAIYNLLGQEVVILVDEPRAAGRYSVVWEGRDRRGLAVTSGVYIYRLQVGAAVQIRKMTLVK